MVLNDSGASINVMNFRTFDGLNKRLEQPLKLRKADLKVVTYGQDNPSLKVKGVVEVLVESENKYQNTEFYVIETMPHRNTSVLKATKISCQETPLSNWVC